MLAKPSVRAKSMTKSLAVINDVLGKDCCHLTEPVKCHGRAVKETGEVQCTYLTGSYCSITSPATDNGCATNDAHRGFAS